ncbi:MAG: ROK family protein [Bosea sp. (in: a-proteobacteria)]
MAFIPSDFDLVAPLAARACLRGWQSGALLPASGFPEDAQAALVSLVEAGLVRREAEGFRRTAPGLRLFVADLGGTKLHAALVDETGAILAERREPTAAGVHAVIEQIVRLRDALACEIGAPLAAVGAAAIGVPGAVDPRSGAVGFAPNIAGLERVDLAVELERRFGHRVRLENDVNLAALGESAAGCAQGLRNFAFVALGTGVGMGLVLDGRLMRGHGGMAGEIALLPVIYGATGKGRAEADATLEDVIGSGGILAAARRLGPVEAQTVEQLFAQARQGDGVAQGAIAATAEVLFKALLAVRALVDPELIVLGGSIGLQSEIAEGLSAHAARAAFAPAIRASTLGPRAVLAGASLAALSELIAPAAARRRLLQKSA